MIDLSPIVVAIPALGAATIAIVALAPRMRAQETSAGGIDPLSFRRIANAATVTALIVLAGLTLVGRFFKTGGAVGGNDCSAAFALVTSAVWLPVVYVARRSEQRRPALLYGLLLLLEAAYLAIFTFESAIWFCAGLEAATVLLYLLTAGWGSVAAEPAARKLLLMNLAADLAILVGLTGVVITSARVSGSVRPEDSRLNFSLTAITRELPRLTTDEIAAQEYWKHARRTILTVLIVGVFLKAPLFPFQTWVAGAVSEGPLCVGLAILGSGLKVGLYLLARFLGPLLGDIGAVSDLIVGLIILGALHVSFLSLAQTNMKRMIACVCLLQGALAIAGFFVVGSAGASGPVLLGLSSAVAGVLALFAFDFLELRYDAAEVGGIARKLPNLATILVLGTLSLVGIPGLFGFLGLYTTLGALLGGEWMFAILAIGASLIGTWSLFWMLQNTVFGVLNVPLPATGEVLFDAGEESPSGAWPGDATAQQWSAVDDGRGHSLDLGTTELLIVGPLVACVIAVGIWPQALAGVLRLALGGTAPVP